MCFVLGNCGGNKNLNFPIESENFPHYDYELLFPFPKEKTVLYRDVSFFVVLFFLIRGAPLTHVKYFDYENISLQASWQNVLEVKDLLLMFYSAWIHSSSIVYLFAIKTMKLIPMYRNNIFKFLGQIIDFYIVLFADIWNILFVNFI